MTTVARRTFRSTPARDALATWTAIVDLLTQGREDAARAELLAVAGVAASVIADHAPRDAPIVVTCDGPRTRIYCLYDDDAIDGSDANEDPLGFDPAQGGLVRIGSLSDRRPVMGSGALIRHSNRITARDPGMRRSPRNNRRTPQTHKPSCWTQGDFSDHDQRRRQHLYALRHLCGGQHTEEHKDIVRFSGLDPANPESMAGRAHAGNSDLALLWPPRDRGTPEIFHPITGALVGRWDIDVIYTTELGDGGFWTDTEQIKYHIRKAGLAPGEARYRLVLQNRSGRPDVDGWEPTRFRVNRRFCLPPPRLDNRALRAGCERGLLETDLMLNVNEAFRKFKSRLELNEREQRNASARHTEVRDFLNTNSRSPAVF